jgi:hypothetical protein
MPDPTLSEAIQEAYAHAPSDAIILHTLELRHSDFRDDAGNPTAIRVVRDQVDSDRPARSRRTAQRGSDGHLHRHGL